MLKKSQKSKNKVGRPRKTNVLREPNGRISRAKHNLSELPIKIRAQKYNLTYEQAKNPRSESWVGRLTFKPGHNGISESQYRAAQCYMNLYNEYRKVICSPGAYYENGRGFSSEETQTKWAKAVKRKFNAACQVITEVQFNNPQDNIHAAIQYCLLEDQELPQLLGALRIALNHLDHHFFPRNRNKEHTKKITLACEKYSKMQMVLYEDNSFAPLHR